MLRLLAFSGEQNFYRLPVYILVTMKINEYIRYGTGRFFDILPTISVKWFYDKKRKIHFDFALTWLCFFIITTNFGRCLVREIEEQNKHSQITKPIQ